MYRNTSIARYLDELAAKLPAPGGGSAAALSAALGAALISMVANFTIGKPKYAAHQAHVKGVLRRSERLRKRFLILVDRDVEAYKSKNLAKSLAVPLEVSRLCAEGIRLCPGLITRGNRNLISDVSVAAVLLEAGFASALCNVEINLRFLRDASYARALRKELTIRKKAVSAIRRATEEKVNAIIRG